MAKGPEENPLNLTGHIFISSVAFHGAELRTNLNCFQGLNLIEYINVRPYSPWMFEFQRCIF